eukprot:TRINITY_DN2986_c0_g1_i1.p1 TRINITY_DN2986_c0_g1~~TRINITY_DN2986_c0_g1_i1.p1  ORF type:complete len:468 (-),score=87.18 TRINITY_DN2986_c0_g1_i1:78-1481(-)
MADTQPNFQVLGISPWLVNTCKKLSIVQATPVQQACIPQILNGRDVSACAETGTGKTAAFVLPILQKLSEDPFGIFALVLSPTRELALQISEQFKLLGRHISVKITTIIGGIAVMQQSQELEQRPHIVVATPGRLADHINASTQLFFKNLRFLVLDEADRFNAENFVNDIEELLPLLPKKKQTLLFSATLNNIGSLPVKLNSPFEYNLSKTQVLEVVDRLEQFYVVVPPFLNVKLCFLLHVLLKIQKKKNKSIIVFFGTCRLCEMLNLMLNRMNMITSSLHSLMPQKDRNSSLSRFKSSYSRILLTTDVASRGLDIPSVELVINFDIPLSAEDYVHRVGRTARAGRTGKSITFANKYQLEKLLDIESVLNQKMSEYEVDEEAAISNLKVVTEAKVHVEMEIEKNPRFIALENRKKRRSTQKDEDESEEEEDQDEEVEETRKETKTLQNEKRPFRSAAHPHKKKSKQR